MLSVTEDTLRDILLRLDFRSLIRLSVTSHPMNQTIAHVVNAFYPEGMNWWRIKLRMDYPYALAGEEGMKPNEAYLIGTAPVMVSVRYAMEHDRPEMLRKISRGAEVSLETLPSEDIAYLVRKSMVGKEQLPSTAYLRALLSRAASATKEYPLQRVQEDLGSLEVFLQMLWVIRLSWATRLNSNDLFVLFNDVVRYQGKSGESTINSIIQEITRQSTSVLPNEVVITNTFRFCVLWKDDVACLAFIDGLSIVNGTKVAIDGCLTVAVEKKREVLVARLLQEGADPNTKYNGNLSLNSAVEVKSESIARMLTDSPLFTRAIVYKTHFNKAGASLKRLIRSLQAAGKVELR